MISIPLVDLAAAHAEVADEVAAGFAEILHSCAFIGGKSVTAFEDAYAAYLGVRHCVGVGNGTDALELALRALGIGPGDEVVLPAHTFIASAEAVARAGATVVLADVTPGTLLLDPERVAAALTRRTRAVMPVDLYGQAAPAEHIATVIGDRDIAILEDAAQSQGARRNGRAAGTLGRIAGTSFYPGKNLGAYGDAGAVLTDDDELASRIRLISQHGSDRKYQHPVLGFNSRMDGLQAVVLAAKLDRLEAGNECRRTAAARYDALLSELAAAGRVVRPVVADGNLPVWHLYVIELDDRDAVLGKLNAAGIGAGIHYPVPVHLHGAFASLGQGVGAFPVSEAAAQRILTLPLYPQITSAQQEHVVAELTKALP